MLNNFLKNFSSGNPVVPVVPPEPPVEKLMRILKGTTNPADTFVAVSEAVETIHKSGNAGDLLSLIMTIQNLSPPGAAMQALEHIIVNTEEAALQVFITTQLNVMQGWYPNAQKWLQEIAAKQTPGPTASAMSTMFTTPPATGPVTKHSATPAVMSFMGETIPIVPREQDVRFTGRSYETPLKFEWPTAKRQRDEDQEDWGQVSRQPKRPTLSSMLSSSASPSTGLQSLLSRPPQSASGLQLLPSRAAPGPAFDQAGSESSLVRRNPFASDELVTKQAMEKAARMVAGMLMPELEQKMDQKIQGMGVQIMQAVDNENKALRAETRQEMGQFQASLQSSLQASLLQLSQESKADSALLLQELRSMKAAAAGAAPAPTGTAKAPAGAAASKAKRGKPAPVTPTDVAKFFVIKKVPITNCILQTFFTPEQIATITTSGKDEITACKEAAGRFRNQVKKQACLAWLNLREAVNTKTKALTDDEVRALADETIKAAGTLAATGADGNASGADGDASGAEGIASGNEGDDSDAEEEKAPGKPNPTGGAGAAAAAANAAASVFDASLVN